MSIKARWASAEIEIPAEDPFQQRVEEVGFPIEIRNGEADLNDRLIELVNTESALFDAGVSCAIKDRSDTTCSACPISAHSDPHAPLRPLCVCGREQESVQTAIAVGRQARATPS